MRAMGLLALLSLLVSACGGSAAPSTPARPSEAAAPAHSAPAPAAQAAPTHITLAYSTASAANSPMQLAQDRGIFRANGLDIELIHAMGNAGPAAVLSGQAQVLATGCAEALAAITGGADFVLTMVWINRMQYVLAGSPTIAGPETLRGKRLAVSRIGSSSHLATKFIVKYLGLDPDQDVSYVQVGNTPERVGALLAGSVDGSILSADEGLLIGNEPGMHIIVDMTTENIPYCGNALGATRQYVRDQPEVMRALTRSFVEAITRFRLDKAEGVQAVAAFLGENDTYKAEQLWGTWVRMLPEKPYPDPRGIQFVLDEVAQTDERARALTPDGVVDPSWVRELDRSGFIDGLNRGAGAR